MGLTKLRIMHIIPILFENRFFENTKPAFVKRVCGHFQKLENLIYSLLCYLEPSLEAGLPEEAGVTYFSKALCLALSASLISRFRRT